MTVGIISYLFTSIIKYINPKYAENCDSVGGFESFSFSLFSNKLTVTIATVLIWTFQLIDPDELGL